MDPRDSGRVILLLDMDAFFVQAEVIAVPRLSGRPLVIGGTPGARGTVATASYEARALGVRSGMSIGKAKRLAPQAVFLPCNPSRYFDLSARVMKLLLRRTPLVEPASIDEAFIDASGIARSLEEGEALAASIQDEISRTLRLTASAGIGPNKLIAKMASVLQKPAGRTVLTRRDFDERFADEPVIALVGVGKSTAARLERAGIRRIADLASAPAPFLRGLLGVWGPILGRVARGEDDSPVVPDGTGPDPKSIGHEYTLPRDETDRSEARRLILALCDEVAGDMRAEHRVGDTVHIKIHWGDFTTVLRQCRLRTAISATQAIFNVALELFRRMDRGGPIRMIGISVSGLVQAESQRPQQIESLFGDDPRFGADPGDKVEPVTDSLRAMYGKGVIRRASLLGENGRRR